MSILILRRHTNCTYVYYHLLQYGYASPSNPPPAATPEDSDLEYEVHAATDMERRRAQYTITGLSLFIVGPTTQAPLPFRPGPTPLPLAPSLQSMLRIVYTFKQSMLRIKTTLLVVSLYPNSRSPQSPRITIPNSRTPKPPECSTLTGSR
jgi:hypothetical protein